MPAIQTPKSELSSAAQALYEGEWKQDLEASHFGEIIAVEPKSRDYVLGKTFREIDQARQARFETQPEFIFRIGGGGAVKIGGEIARGRNS